MMHYSQKKCHEILLICAFLVYVNFLLSQNNSIIQNVHNFKTNPSIINNITSPVTFTKVTQGIIVNDDGLSNSAAWGDFDNDGLLDLFVADNDDTTMNYLYKNNGDGHFTKIAESPIVNDISSWSQACSWGDYNNDNNLDLFVANDDGDNNYLYKNNGDGTFEKIRDAVIVGSQGYGCSWGDYNNDGFLDMFVASNNLYMNQGDGTFIKLTAGSIANDAGSRGCSWADYDNDGDLDLFLANDEDRNNFLYANNGNGSFVKITTGSIVNDGGESTGGSWGDYDRDGDLDLYVTNFNEMNFFYQNNGDGTFQKIETGEIVTDIESSHCSSWCDYDNDGDPDLYITNSDGDFGRNNSLYINNGDGAFTKITDGVIVNDLQISLGCCWGDYDNDGDLDLFVANDNGINNTLFNNNGNDNAWINIKCIGTLSNQSAIGAKVRLKATINDISVWQLNEISGQTGGGFGGQNSLNAEFGLGDASFIDSIRIEWPSGIVQDTTHVAVNQFLTIKEKNDVEAPSIGTVTAAVVQDMNTSVDISTTVSDNKNIQQVRLYYHEGGDTDFQSLVMSGMDGIYQAEIPSIVVNSGGVEYFIEAKDSSHNKTRTDLLSVIVRLPENHLTRHHPGGQAADSYRLISFPLDMDDLSVTTTLLDDLGKSDSLNWRLWDIDPQRKGTMFPYREFPDVTNMAPGRAKFLITREPVTLTSEPGVTVNTVSPFEIELQEGWNMVASPYNFNIPITNVEPESLHVHLYSYNGNWLSAPDTLEPWNGYMIKVNESTTLSINASVDQSSQNFTISKLLSGPDWSINIEAICEQANDKENSVGIIHDASLEWDEYERFEPPPIGEFVTLCFPHREWHRFPDIHSTDFRPPSDDGYIWDFEVFTNLQGKQVTLEFKNLDFVPKELGIMLIDSDLKIDQDLRQNQQYDFRSSNSRKTRQFKLVVGSEKFVKDRSAEIAGAPETFELYQNFPNPFNPTTTIKYGLSRTSNISLKIYNILGQEIITLLDDIEKQTGYHTIVWDSWDYHGQIVPNGIYFILLRNDETILSKKMTVLK